MKCHPLCFIIIFKITFKNVDTLYYLMRKSFKFLLEEGIGRFFSSSKVIFTTVYWLKHQGIAVVHPVHSQTVVIASQFTSVQFSHSVMSDSLRPHGLQHSRPPCPSPTPRACSNSCQSSQWHHPTISSSVFPFSSCLQSCPASGSFPMSQFFASGGQSIGVSASESVLPMNIQDWFPLVWTGLISLLSKGLSRIFSYTTVQKHQFFSTQLSL